MARMGGDDLARVRPVLDQLRALDALHERTPGTFTAKGAPFLHFHSRATGIVADLKVGGDWRRYDVERAAGRRVFVRDVRRVLRGVRTGLGGEPT